MQKVPPLKPYQAGRINSQFGGPASSPLDVLERTRVALSPRGAWKKGGYKGTSHEGATRCVLQCFRDVDGIHVDPATKIFLRAVKEVTGQTYSSVPTFNDASATQKYHVILSLDRAIEIAGGNS